jgi:hypothetical protein
MNNNLNNNNNNNPWVLGHPLNQNHGGGFSHVNLREEYHFRDANSGHNTEPTKVFPEVYTYNGSVRTKYMLDQLEQQNRNVGNINR